MSPDHPIPPAFTARKSAILTSLSVPHQSYTDLSPKGTVDTAIVDLITRINNLEGVVTTSSCAGRVSVFLEGRKGGKKGKDDIGNGTDRGEVAVPGGKGMGGRWLFVAHEPVKVEGNGESVASMLGLEPITNGQPGATLNRVPSELRLVRFQFEPMILHIMAASLHHAQPVLTAAINAGFRESGIQSLKNLDDANSFPMIAVRSSGLALESVIGTSIDGREQNEGGVESIVSEEYLNLLVRLANERFKTNTERTKRFEMDLFGKETKCKVGWEDSEARKERKRAEGLEKRSSLRREAPASNIHNDVQSAVDEDNTFNSGSLLGSLSNS